MKRVAAVVVVSVALAACSGGSSAPRVEIGLGVDYLLTRRIALGFVVRYHAYLTALTQIPVYLYAGPRLALHFGG